MQVELGTHLFVAALAWVATCGMVFAADAAKTGQVDLLNPVFLFSTLYLIYNGFVFLDSDRWLSDGAPEFAFAAMMGQFGIVLGALLALSYAASARSALSPVLPQGRLLLWGLGLAGLSFAMLVYMFVSRLGLGHLFFADAFERAAATSGILTGFNYLLPIGIGFSAPLLYHYGGALRFPALAAIAVALGFLFYISASRGQILQSSFLSLLVYHACIRKISPRLVMAAGAAVFIALIVMGIVRARIGQDAEAIAEVVNQQNIVQQMGITSLEPYKCGVRNIEAIHNGPPDGEYLLGTSLFYFVPYMVPRAVFELQRPVLLDAWYMNAYAPEIAAIGGGLGFSPLVDAYFNLGAAGCLIYGFFAAFLLGRMHVSALNAPAFSRLRLTACLVTTTMIEIHRLSIAGYIKNYLYVFVFAGFLFLTLCLYSQRRAPQEGALREPV